MRLTAITLSLLIALAGTASADPGKGKGHTKQGGQDGRTASNSLNLSVSIRFGADEAQTITDYYRGRPAQGSLPPGIAKNLARGKPLPPGIAKKYLPGDLTARLPRLDDRYLRVVVGRDVLLIEAGSGLILDVLKSVLG